VRRAEYFSLKDVSEDEIPLSSAIICELVFCDRNPDDNGMKRFTSLSAERVEREKVALSRLNEGEIEKRAVWEGCLIAVAWLVLILGS
jgi:hypothetical protein